MTPKLPESWQEWSPEEKKKLLATLKFAQWRQKARPDQLPPPGPWVTLYLRGGRGSGKTWSGGHILLERVLADPEPGEWAVVAPTYEDAWATCCEGPSGILAALGTNAVHVKQHESPLVRYWNRTMGELRMRNGHLIRFASADDGALRIQGKNLKGVWCIARGETVTTARGEIPVEAVRAGDQVWTRKGWRSVTRAGLTAVSVPVVRLQTADGQSIRLTPEHKVWTQHGWQQAKDIKAGTHVLTCQPQDPPPTTHGADAAGTGAPADTTRTAPAECFTSPYGNTPTAGGSIRSAPSTISTTIPETTPRKTSPQCPVKHTCENTDCWAPHTAKQRRPPSPKECAHPGQCAHRASGPAPSAARPTTLPASAPNTAPMHAVKGTTVEHVANSGHSDVYDLTVSQDAPEFFAGRILVHNCDEIGLWDKWQTAWDESIQYAVRMGDAIRIVTGTPKSSRKARELIKRLVLDPAVHVQVLRTVDNAANLSPAFMASVVAAAKGTRLERQELEGELLEDVDGALWTLEMIERGRVDEHPELSRIVVAVDPAVTGSETSDESGIVVVGEHKGHGYVLADYSMVGSPQEVMEKVVWAYHEHQADRVLAEVNNGGDYIGTLLRVVDSSVPYQAVRATRGKLLRAEPVAALYEQGRMHHVGRYTDLEEQMIIWHPDSSKSPDRLDALAWAVAGLRTLTAGSWAQAHGIAYCDECQQPFMLRLHPLTCPNCHTPHGKGSEIGS